MDNRQNALIEVEGLKKFYKNRGTGGLFKKKKMVQAVGGVSFEIRKGEIFGVIGESGCGKSTMGRTLVNLEAPTAGDVRINGESARAILQKDPKAFHQMVQMVFQNPFDTFLPTETIEQIMLRPLEINGLGGSEEERRQRIVQLLEDGGLSPAEDFLGRYPHELSGGQLQRISILRAMSVNPLFLVVDEPVSMLDVSVRADIINMLLDLTKKYQTSILFISHDIAVIRYVASRTAVMYLGRIVEMGDTDALIQHPCTPTRRRWCPTAPPSTSTATWRRSMWRASRPPRWTRAPAATLPTAAPAPAKSAGRNTRRRPACPTGVWSPAIL